MPRYCFVVFVTLLISCTQQSQKPNPDGTFQISDEDLGNDADLEEFGFKNIRLGRRIEDFNFGSDWKIETKSVLGETFGDSIVSAKDTSYHARIGRHRVDIVDLTFVNGRLIAIEVQMTKQTITKEKEVASNLMPILIDEYGEPNVTPHGLAASRNDDVALFLPKLIPFMDSSTPGMSFETFKELSEEDASEEKNETPWAFFYFAVWEKGGTRLVCHQEEHFDLGVPDKRRYEILRYFASDADDIDKRVYKRSMARQIKSTNP